MPASGPSLESPFARWVFGWVHSRTTDNHVEASGMIEMSTDIARGVIASNDMVNVDLYSASTCYPCDVKAYPLLCHLCPP